MAVKDYWLMQLDRSAGVLLHFTSLPGEFGVGDLGLNAYRFVDFLEKAGQRVWQVLPLGPTVHGDSPYSCYSAFAGNFLLVSIEKMQSDGLLTAEQGANLRVWAKACDQHAEEGECDYQLARSVKREALNQAFDAFTKATNCERIDDFEAFCTQQKSWLDDFALFAALMKHYGTDDWTQWEPGLVARQTQAMVAWREKLSREIEFEQFVQFVFFEQWDALRDYANRRNVKLFGDMPIFVAHGSADVWSNQSCFCLRRDGKPRVVAGVPPDYFSKTGQLWGNPLYDWQVMEEQKYRWWVERLRVAFETFDLLRIDHFRGFEAYWEVPSSAKTAVSGQWVLGPGAAPFEAARDILGDLPIVAEDLGLITDEVHELRDELNFPGMRVFQFGFDNPQDEYHRPKAYPTNSVAYTGTHDNSTIMGWYAGGRDNPSRRELLAEYLGDNFSDDELHWQILSAVFRSDSALAIAPLQDILGLEDTARMNIPGEPSGNWKWRYRADTLTDGVAARLRSECESTSR